LSSCGNINTDVLIQSDELTSITINGIQSIDGFLNVLNSSSLTSISAPDLEWISQDFKLQNLRLLANISFPRLETAAEGVYWEFLPAFVHLSLDAFSRAGDVRIKNNSDLKFVNLTSLVYGLNLEMENNHADAQILLGGLTSSSSLLVGGAASVDISKLATTDGNFNITRNNFQEFAAPLLTQIGGDFIVVDNDQLIHLNLPLLETIGGSSVVGDCVVANNPALPSLTLSSLTYVDGNTTIAGNFSR